MKEHKSVIFLSILIFVLEFAAGAPPSKSSQLNEADLGTGTVQYVTAIFRDGERTVDAGTVYPKDIYINETYYPYGVGQLTSRGKEREYALGLLLRKRYDALLGNIYTPEFLDPISTDMNRTKASLELVLGGLYQPKGNIMEWSSKLNWQPIPYNYLNYEKDPWFTISIYFCANYAKEYDAYLASDEGKKIQEKYANLFQYLRDNTGLNIKRTMEVFFVRSCIQSQSEWGLTLPEWTEKVWPEQLEDATKDGLASSVATPKLKQLSGGLLLKKVIENMKAKANNTLEMEPRKMTLLSGHDLNIVYILAAMNVFIPHVVPYGACVMIELHKISDQHFVKILYEDYTADVSKTLTVPGCEELCPLNKFETLLKVNIPAKDNVCGDDVTVFKEHTEQRDYYNGKLQYRSVVRRYIEWFVSTGGRLVKGVFYIGKGFAEKAAETVDINIIEKGKQHLGRLPNPFGL